MYARLITKERMKELIAFFITSGWPRSRQNSTVYGRNKYEFTINILGMCSALPVSHMPIFSKIKS